MRRTKRGPGGENRHKNAVRLKLLVERQIAAPVTVHRESHCTIRAEAVSEQHWHKEQEAIPAWSPKKSQKLSLGQRNGGGHRIRL